MNSKIKDFRFRVENLKIKKEKTIKQIAETKKEIKDIENKKEIIEESYQIIQTVARQTQQKLEFGLSDLPSKALSYVYEVPYKFKVKFVERRGKTEADILFEKYGIEFKPGKRTGYGPVDIATLGMRLVIYKLRQPKLRNVILLDEPFPSIDKEVQPKISDLLQSLAENNNTQIIMITHNDNLMKAANKQFRVTMVDEISNVEEL